MGIMHVHCSVFMRVLEVTFLVQGMPRPQNTHTEIHFAPILCLMSTEHDLLHLPHTQSLLPLICHQDECVLWCESPSQQVGTAVGNSRFVSAVFCSERLTHCAKEFFLATCILFRSTEDLKIIATGRTGWCGRWFLFTLNRLLSKVWSNSWFYCQLGNLQGGQGWKGNESWFCMACHLGDPACRNSDTLSSCFQM